MAVLTNPEISARIAATGNPVYTIIARTGVSLRFYEHPTLGDGAAMIAVFPDGNLDFDTAAYDLSTARLYAGLDQ